MSMTTALTPSMSKEFFDFVKSIGESKSKQQEDRIVFREISTLKTKMNSKNVTSKKMKEYLIRMVYVEMLGHDASFGHIHAVKMTQKGSLIERRIGYLCCVLCLHSEHELMLLLIGGLQTDLQSDNNLVVATALIIVSKLVGRETLPALLPSVMKLLNHQNTNIRKKAVIALQRFNQIDEQILVGEIDKLTKILCDKDPSVMGASLYLFYDLIIKDVSPYKKLLPVFTSILKQVIERRLEVDYDYHRVPAPQIQIQLLKIMRLLATSDKQASELVYEILLSALRQADVGNNIGYAVVYEVVRTISQIYPNTRLLEAAAKRVSRFITSDIHNLKYLAIDALTMIIQVNPIYAAKHQLVVIDCLENSDESLRRKTLDLLYRMTNPENVIVVVEKLQHFLKTSVDTFLKTELITKIFELAENYAPSSNWYIETLITIFELGGDLVKSEVVHKYVRLISEFEISEQQQKQSNESNLSIGQFAVDMFYDFLLDKSTVFDVMLKIIVWTFGEYGHKSSKLQLRDVIDCLFDIMERPLGSDSDVRSQAIFSIMKLVSRAQNDTHIDQNMLCQDIEFKTQNYLKSVNSVLQQQSHELLELIKKRPLFKTAFSSLQNHDKLDLIRENDFDQDLSFLNQYVEKALEDGALPYKPFDFGDSNHLFDMNGESHESNIVIQPYPKYDQNKINSSSSIAVPQNNNSALFDYIPNDSNQQHQKLASSPISGSHILSDTKENNIEDEDDLSLDVIKPASGPQGNQMIEETEEVESLPIEDQNDNAGRNRSVSKNSTDSNVSTSTSTTINAEEESEIVNSQNDIHEKQQSDILTNLTASTSYQQNIHSNETNNIDHRNKSYSQKEVSRPLTEKELLGSQLFRGVVGTSNTSQPGYSSYNSRSVKQPKERKSEQISKPKPANKKSSSKSKQTSDNDLLSVFDLISPENEAKNSKNVQSNTDSLDLLMNLTSSDFKSTNQTSKLDSNSLLNFEIAGSNSNKPHLTETKDFMNLMNMGELSLLSQEPKVYVFGDYKKQYPNQNKNETEAPSFFADLNYKGLLRHKWTNKSKNEIILIETSNICLSYIKAQEDQRTFVILFLIAKTKNLDNAQFRANFKNISAYFDTDKGCYPYFKKFNEDFNNNSICIKSKDIVKATGDNHCSYACIQFLAVDSIQDINFNQDKILDLNLNCEFQYKVSGDLKMTNTPFVIPLTETDFFRPQKIDTSKFGQLQGTLACEKTFKIATNLPSSLQLFIDKLTSFDGLHFYHVETIKSEVIASAKILSNDKSSNANNFVLLHSRLDLQSFQKAINITIRSTKNFYLELVSNAFKLFFK